MERLEMIDVAGYSVFVPYSLYSQNINVKCVINSLRIALAFTVRSYTFAKRIHFSCFPHHAPCVSQSWLTTSPGTTILSVAEPVEAPPLNINARLRVASGCGVSWFIVYHHKNSRHPLCSSLSKPRFVHTMLVPKVIEPVEMPMCSICQVPTKVVFP